MQVAIAGGGVARLASALAPSRHGNDVTPVKRDQWQTDADWRKRLRMAAVRNPPLRPVARVLPRGTVALRREFADVYESLLETGEKELEVWRKLPGGDFQTEDREIVILAVRRQLIEWTLRSALAREPCLRVAGSTKVCGLLADGAPVPVVTGPRLAKRRPARSGFGRGRHGPDLAAWHLAGDGRGPGEPLFLPLPPAET